jgi:hypothetical protein
LLTFVTALRIIQRHVAPPPSILVGILVESGSLLKISNAVKMAKRYVPPAAYSLCYGPQTMIIITIHLTGLSPKSTTASIKDRVSRLLHGSTVHEVQLLAGPNAGSKKAVVQAQTHVKIGEAKRLLSQGKFDKKHLAVDIRDRSAGANLRGREASKKSKKGAARNRAQELATSFHSHIKSDGDLISRCSDRDVFSQTFQGFLSSKINSMEKRSERKQIEFSVVIQLKKMKLLRSKRLGDANTLFTLAGAKGPGDFPSSAAVQSNRQHVINNKSSEAANKGGVEVTDPQVKGVLTKPNASLELPFSVSSSDKQFAVTHISLARNKSNAFSLVKVVLPTLLRSNFRFFVIFKPKNVRIYSCAVRMTLKDNAQNLFQIVRHVRLKSGDHEIHGILKPRAPYQPKIRATPKPKSKQIIKAPGSNSSGVNPFIGVPHEFVPRGVEKCLENGELAQKLKKPEHSLDNYVSFWKNILWASEFQAQEDIKFFDMEKV